MMDSFAACRVETVVTGQIDRPGREDRERGSDRNDMAHCYGSLTSGHRAASIRLHTETEGDRAASVPGAADPLAGSMHDQWIKRNTLFL